MTIEKEYLISLLKNRQVFNKQYSYNTMQLLKHYSKDKLAIFLWTVVFSFIAYSAVKGAGYIGFFVLSASVFFFVLFLYYAFRAHDYKNFTKESDNLILSVHVKILKGKILAIYIPKISCELSEHIIDFLKEDSRVSKQVEWILNTRWRRGNKSEFNKEELLIVSAVKEKYNIDIEFHLANSEQEIIDLSGFKITQTYTNHEQLKKLEVSNADIPWLICKITIKLILIGGLLLLIAALKG